MTLTGQELRVHRPVGVLFQGFLASRSCICKQKSEPWAKSGASWTSSRNPECDRGGLKAVEQSKSVDRMLT